MIVNAELVKRHSLQHCSDNTTSLYILRIDNSIIDDMGSQ